MSKLKVFAQWTIDGTEAVLCVGEHEAMQWNMTEEGYSTGRGESDQDAADRFVAGKLRELLEKPR